MSSLPGRALHNLLAPAKLNHFLHVTGRRANGYHELESVFQRVDWCDRLDIALATDGQLHFEMVNESGQALAPELANLPPQDNLVVRAAAGLREQFSEYPLTRQGAVIKLFKSLPSGAGMGGGSSDAATVLLGLNQLWGIHASTEVLQTLALTLGADLPFFFARSRRLCKRNRRKAASIDPASAVFCRHLPRHQRANCGNIYPSKIDKGLDSGQNFGLSSKAVAR